MTKIYHNRYALFFFWFFLIITSINLGAHTYRVPLVVDTDMGLDDCRALVLLYNSGMADIQAVITSDGALSPAAGVHNLNQLFALLDQQKLNFKTAAGRDLKSPPPPWRHWTKNIFSSNNQGKGDEPPKLDTGNIGQFTGISNMAAVLEAEDTPFVYLCLGPLTNLAELLQTHPNLVKHISRVIYYGTSPQSNPTAWNTQRDMEAARKVFASGLKIILIGSPQGDNSKLIPFDRTFFQQIEALGTPAARAFVQIHKLPTIQKLLDSKHFRVWDELAIIYMSRPDLFQLAPLPNLANSLVVQNYDNQAIKEQYIKLLGYTADSHLAERRLVVFRDFPVDPKLFQDDTAPFVKKIIETYGLEEWKAAVLTNEFHRHLGIYSIIGVKMGIRAREILEAPFDTLEVVSYAGNKPPLSCLNDGLQVSTGASLGRGTISIAPLPQQGNRKPAALFKYGEEQLTLRVKPEIIQQIKQDILAAIEKYGNVTPEYFDYIRKLSIQYWLKLDREKIFIEE